MGKSIILIVDDSPENLNVLKGLLGGAYNLKASPNGKVALKIANIVPQPDLILLDIMMPGMDGYEVCQRLKSDNLTKHIPIIMVTGEMTEFESKLNGMHQGADAFLFKPIHIEELNATFICATNSSI